MLKTLEMDLTFLPYLQEAPFTPAQLQQKAVSNDAQTIEAWKDIWVKNAATNHKKYGPFKNNHIGMMFDHLRLKPCIVLGSGPSLENSIKALKNNKDIFVISCLHNFHYLIDNEIKVDLWVTLDSGHITIEEMSEGGMNPHEYYLEKTRDQKLAAFISTDPNLIASWQGEVLWYSAGIPDKDVAKGLADIEPFDIVVSNGGNVLGGAMYIAKAFLGANPICFGGADFCFGYKKNFHPWPSKYDGKLGRVLTAHDIFGNKVFTWQSYQNFRHWFEGVSMRCPGIWMNASEGGTLGSYWNGLIPSIRQTTMHEFISMYTIHENIRYLAEHPEDGKEPGKPGPVVLF